MRLNGVAWRGFAVPFRRPYVTSDTRATARYGLLLLLHAENGLVGIGEASPVGAGTMRQVERIAACIKDLAPRLLGRDLAGHPLLTPDVPPVVRFGIETALLDLEGKARGCTVAALLGGAAYPLPVNCLISAGRPEEAVDEAKRAVALGFTSLKLKVATGTITQDEALVSSVRQAVGPGVKLRIDPNQGWTVSQAIEAIQRLAPYGLEYVEQPVPANDLASLRQLRSTLSIPIAADEALASVDDLRRLLAADDADLFILKAGRLGGLEEALEVMQMAARAGKPVVVTSSLESGVAIAASAHLASLLPSHPFAHGLATGLLLQSDLLSPPLLISQGILTTPQGPGLGVAVDTEALERYSIGVKGWVGSSSGSSSVGLT